MPRLLWTPSQEDITNSQIADFAKYLKSKNIFDWDFDYENLWRFSTERNDEFWDNLWDWHGVVGSKGGGSKEGGIVDQPDAMLGGQFFTGGQLNFAENILADADDSAAIIAHQDNDGGNGKSRYLSRRDLKKQVMALAGWMQSRGIVAGDRVAAYTPNIPEAVVVMLAAASIGAVFSSCSSDFGLDGVADRFGQIKPVLLMAADGYRYGDKVFNRLDIIGDIAAAIPSIRDVLIVPFLDASPNISGINNAVMFDDALAADPILSFAPMPFNHPLYILYSSGTTGVPKCIVHGAGGTLLQHIKEHRLHCDIRGGNIRGGDVVFYFTTCGWMMWNWLVSALAVKAAIVLYEGQPFAGGVNRLWDMIAEDKITLFGTSAKYIDAVRKSGYRPCDSADLSSLRLICSTGSPLSADGFDFIYDGVASDVQLASISGGTDLVSCFVLGCPVKPVYAGEIQCRGLGMAVEVWDDAGESVAGTQGELVCVKPFPSMPIGFWGDSDGAKYRAAYFEHFAGVWRHGDWATVTERGGIIIHGRSDATLNPGGVRIGTAEIYRQVEAFDAVFESLVIGQSVIEDGLCDVRVILFVRLAAGYVLDDGLRAAIKSAIRQGATARHVPSLILEVGDIPRTRSGKITELAVRDVVEGRRVGNTEALANPESLDYFRNRPELAL